MSTFKKEDFYLNLYFYVINFRANSNPVNTWIFRNFESKLRITFTLSDIYINFLFFNLKICSGGPCIIYTKNAYAYYILLFFVFRNTQWKTIKHIYINLVYYWIDIPLWLCELNLEILYWTCTCICMYRCFKMFKKPFKNFKMLYFFHCSIWIHCY